MCGSQYVYDNSARLPQGTTIAASGPFPGATSSRAGVRGFTRFLTTYTAGMNTRPGGTRDPTPLDWKLEIPTSICTPAVFQVFSSTH